MKTADGKISDQFGANILTRKYGEFISLEAVEYRHARSSGFFRPSSSGGISNYIQPAIGTVLVVGTTKGVHFFELADHGGLVHYVSMEAGGAPTIRFVRVGWMRARGGSETREAVEVINNGQSQHYDATSRTIIPRAAVLDLP